MSHDADDNAPLDDNGNALAYSVFGNYGWLSVDPVTGAVLVVHHEDPTDPVYASIVKFDVDEYRQWVQHTPLAGMAEHLVDIVDIGYWTQHGVYETPLYAHRAHRWGIARAPDANDNEAIDE